MQKITVGNWGRILFGLVFVIFGVLHFVNLEGVAGAVPGFLPFPSFLAIVVGIIMLVTGAAILAKRYVRLAASTLAILLAVLIILVHLPALPVSLANFLKDLGLIAGALLILSNYPHQDN